MPNTSQFRRQTLRIIDGALATGGYSRKKTRYGYSPLGNLYRITRVVTKKGREYAIAIQHQEMGGTAEQKIANHLMCLGATADYSRKYLVLGGHGWSARANNRALNRYITNASTVRIISLRRFAARAKAGIL